MPNLKLAIRGDYQKVIDSRRKAVLTGLRKATMESSSIVKSEMRRDIIRAGLGNRLAFTVQDSIFPRQGLSFSPSAMVYSKAPHILSTFADGASLSARRSEFMAIPINGGPADKLRRKRGQSLIEAFEAKYGQNSLHYVKRSGGTPLLVAKLKRTEAGRYVKKKSLQPLKKRQGPRVNKGTDVTVPVFTLAKRAQHQRNLNLRPIMEKGRRRHPARVAFHLQRQLEASNAETRQR